MTEPTETEAVNMHPPTLGPAQNLPDDVLSHIFDHYTRDGFSALKSAVLVNKTFYTRYQGKLYTHVRLNKHNIAGFQLHAILDLSSADVSSSAGVGSRRFTSFCQSMVYLTIEDREAGQQLAEVLDSSGLQGIRKLFKNVEHLTLEAEFMRYLGDPKTFEDPFRMTSKRIMEVLGWAMEPKHLCIDMNRKIKGKKYCSSEVWRIRVLKTDWSLESITQHDTLDRRLVYYEGIPTQRFLLHGIPTSSRLLEARLLEPSRIPITVEIVSAFTPSLHSVEMDKLSPHIAKKVKVKVVEIGDAEPCCCCGRK